MEYKRGSEWRRWDFHIHTPETKKNDQFKSSDSFSKWEKYYNDIKEYIGDKTETQKTIAAIGITDYFSIENYKKVISEGKLKNTIDFIFPNIELRCLPLKDGRKMNVHLLINPTFVDKVDTIILSNLTFETNDTVYSARKEDLIRFGKDLDPTIQDDFIAYKKGIENFNVDFSAIIDLLKKYPECRDNVLVAIPNSNVDGASAVGNPSIKSELQDLFEYRKELYKTANMILSANPTDINFFLGNADKKPVKIMPCIFGCDAHKNEDIFEPKDDKNNPTKKYCWIKADPSWEGLKQALYEPKERVKIQELCPDDRVDNYRIIDKIVIEDNITPHRFSNESIYLNKNLNCIIGLKSTGKSILLNNIADTINHTETINKYDLIYSGKKKIFEFPVKVYWKDGLVSTKDDNKNKKIIYIPQSYLNNLMDDLAEKTEIDTIIENIVKQSIDFNELNNDFSKNIQNIQKEIETYIVDLIYQYNEIQTQKNFIKEFGNEDSIKNNIKQLTNKKTKLINDLQISNADLDKYDNTNKQLQLKLVNIQQTKNDLTNIKNIETIIIKKPIEKLNNDFFNQNLNDFIDNIILEANQRWASYKQHLCNDILEDINKTEKNINDYTTTINELMPKIVKNEEISKIEKDLKYEEDNLYKLSKEKEKLKNFNNKFEVILQKILTTTSKREELYDKFVEDFKDLNFEDTNEHFKIISEKRRRRKYFKENLENTYTNAALKNIHDGVLSKINDVNLILENEYDELCKKDYILATLNNEYKKVLLAKKDINSALKVLLQDYDNIIYSIEMDGDIIQNMSPGKKALVLLKLLISLDKSKYPILLDQPEDDLDNLSIVTELVDFIKERKKDRQIILVTHNANLVLGCDSEEIIIANQEIQNLPNTKNHEFRFEYRTGSIENTNIIDQNTFLGSKGIQGHICEILEGGEEAFKIRKNKYTNIIL